MLVKGLPVEIKFAALMVAVLLGFSVYYGLPIRLPGAGGAEFVGIHYLFPLLGLLVWAGCVAFGSKQSSVKPLLLALPCYAIVLLVHFHLKLWTPILNRNRYDDVYWAIDQHLRPLIEICFAIRRAILPLISYEANLYMVGFIALFYGSFCYHAIKTPDQFRKLFLAMLFMQGLGAIAYLIAPAAGPFLYEPGLNPHITQAQHYMNAVRQQVGAGGAQWLSFNEPNVLMAGVGAMPSLHVGSSFVFLWFAIKHGRVLLPTYVPLFAYIVINSIASRWHYLIDLPAGLALACFSLWLAHRCTRPQPIAEGGASPKQSVALQVAGRSPHPRYISAMSRSAGRDAHGHKRST